MSPSAAGRAPGVPWRGATSWPLRRSRRRRSPVRCSPTSPGTRPDAVARCPPAAGAPDQARRPPGAQPRTVPERKEAAGVTTETRERRDDAKQRLHRTLRERRRTVVLRRVLAVAVWAVALAVVAAVVAAWSGAGADDRAES